MTSSFPIVTGAAASLLRPNIDAMTIAPRTPAEKGGADTQGGPETVQPRDLFAFLRFREDGSEIADGVLNQPEFRTAKFLIAGANFGCGSAREHSVWALCAFGIQCVIAPSFGQLFYGNCFKNRVVPIELPEAETVALAQECAAGSPSAHLTLDLDRRLLVTQSDRKIAFTLPEFRYRQLVEGLDEIDMTMSRSDAITEFHRAARVKRPWIYGGRASA